MYIYNSFFFIFIFIDIYKMIKTKNLKRTCKLEKKEVGQSNLEKLYNRIKRNNLTSQEK